MPYQLHDGPRIETEDPALVIQTLAANAFGGPLTSERYIQDLQDRSELAAGQRLESTDPKTVVAFLERAAIITKY